MFIILFCFIYFLKTFQRYKYLVFLRPLQDYEQNGNDEQSLSQELDVESADADPVENESVCLINFV